MSPKLRAPQSKFSIRTVSRKVIALGVALPVAALLVISSTSTPGTSVALDLTPTATSAISKSLVAHPVTGAIPFTGDLKAKKRLAKIAAAKAKKIATARERARLAKISRNFTRPVVNYRLSASFGSKSRLWAHRHTGQDFAAAYGAPVRAAESGVVVFAGWDGPYGRKIAIRHPNGVQTWYGHLSRISVKVGQNVKVGKRIGSVGASGNVTGTHLHFEVRKYGVPVNPVKWLRSMGIWV
ncbi:unannotated protein [freshwater metagenome]|uniref:Unannotated protein n=1 Tax=freshwater metagenome TaxID=449393 RepID=A0A6J6NAI0_9ZZZZ|nr:peptidoglycan DD-metalloendopeptidase family protein [Actinomycetota bacterium]MSY51637.1 peptidoglycan DD-metalloendopeptidase family protein [Actinomycetota bacterium]MSY88020.1 peptidoglycan DD-metalloendopeptidase family protein [Actinomycetota bacterium]MTA51024.1 peptidoglycan DD-metalloendopeptidase family protein [Actinomycetota bacterium]